MRFDFRTELGKMTPRIAQGVKIYIFGTGKGLDYSRKQYKDLVNYDLEKSIDGYIDNDTKKQGTVLHGKSVSSLDDIDTDNSVIIISVSTYPYMKQIVKQLTSKGLLHQHSFFTCEVFLDLLMRWQYMRMLSFKNKHLNERCFIIGNGPSLVASDLDKLKNEVTFATNRIYLMFDETEWRPSYYTISDFEVLAQDHAEIKEKIHCPIFYSFNIVHNIENFSLSGNHFFYVDTQNRWLPAHLFKIKFSDEPTLMPSGGTVTFNCMQIAAFMGFKEIYLLGVDHSSPLTISNTGVITICDNNDRHFSKSYASTYGSTYFISAIDVANAAYQSAQEYALENNFNIYNATRGGKLEIFKRVDFDDLF